MAVPLTSGPYSGKVLIIGGYNGNVLASTELYDPATNTFSTNSASLITGRSNATATTLTSGPNAGKILIIGGATDDTDVLNSTELYNPATNTFSANSATLITARNNHTATLLTTGPNAGKVIVIGGYGGFAGNPLSTELYDPASNTFSANSATLSAERVNATATLLTSGPNSGQILVAGGQDNTSVLYDPVANAFSANSATLTTARSGHATAPLANGSLFITGGYNNGSLKTTEVYDPTANIFSANATTLTTARADATATLLTSGPNSGKVLVVGGYNNAKGNVVYLASAELLSPVYSGLTVTNTNGVTTVAPGYNTTYTFTLTNNGTSDAQNVTLSNAVPTNATFVSAAQTAGSAFSRTLPTAGNNNTFTATTGTLAVGASATFTLTVTLNANATGTLSDTANATTTTTEANTYNSSATDNDTVFNFNYDSANLHLERWQHTTTLLPSGPDAGKLLIAGGFDGSYLSSTELYDPATNTFSNNSATLQTARDHYTATLLTSGPNTGKILVIGGYNANVSGFFLSSTELYDPTTNSFLTNSATLSMGLSDHTATPLTSGPNAGKILIIGGGSNGSGVSSTELYDPATNTFSANSATLNTARSGHRAIPLTAGPNAGKILIVGGVDVNDAFLSSTELYDPATNSFSPNSATLNTPRYSPTATFLPGSPNAGLILIAGGEDGGSLTSAELYDPATNTFSTASPDLTTPRNGHTATLLTSGPNAGLIIMIGGSDGNNSELATTEFYYPSIPYVTITNTDGVSSLTAGSNTTYTLTVTNNGTSDAQNVTLSDAVPTNATFVSATQTAGPTFARTLPTAGNNNTFSATAGTLAAGATATFTFTVTLNSNATGNLLNTASVAATTNGSAATSSVTDTDNTFNFNSPTLITARTYHMAVLLTSGPNSGKVLIIGGYNGNVLASTELYDPATNAFSTNSATLITGRSNATATLLTSGPNAGKILIVGGATDDTDVLDSTELYDPASNTFSANSATLITARNNHTATLLTTGPNAGKVLIIGGYGGFAGNPLGTELYDPTSNTFSANSATLSAERIDATATLLTSGPNSGKILVAGGEDNTSVLYDPVANSFSANSATLTTARSGHGATLLANGQVFITGGDLGYNINALATTELYNPSTNTFSANAATLNIPRDDATATLLTSGPNSGKVLIAGGYNDASGYLASAELISPIYSNPTVTITDGATSATAGSSTTYTITVTNNTGADAQNFTLSNALPAGTTFSAAQQTGGPVFTLTPPGAGNNNTFSATVGSLPLGATATFTLTLGLNSNASGNLADTASVAATVGGNATSTSATDTDTITTAVDLSVANVPSTSGPQAGANLTYTITLHNAGPSDAAGVNLNTTLPAHTTFVSLSTPDGFSATTPAVGSGGTISAGATSLAAGADAVFTLVAQIDANASNGTAVNDTAAVTTAARVDTNDNTPSITARPPLLLSRPSIRLQSIRCRARRPSTRIRPLPSPARGATALRWLMPMRAARRSKSAWAQRTARWP